jgi:Putative Actinobacterial Holin-X, holin superfamily III
MSTSTSGRADPPAGTAHEDPTLGALVHDLAQEIPQLIRSEMRLAQAEMKEKGKRAGLGIGMFSAAGLLAFLGLCCVVTTAILGLAHAIPDWLSALVVAVVLFAGAGVVALAGKREVQQATPPAPEHAIEGVKEDIAVVKGEHR